MFGQQAPAAGADYQKLRTKRVTEILKSQNMSNDDFVFLDNYIKTYFPEASKSLKTTLTQDALKKVFQGIQYKEIDTGESVLDTTESTKSFVLVVSGKIDIIEEANSLSPVKSFAKGEVINPSEVLSLSQPSQELKAVCTEKCEVLIYGKDLLESIIKEFESAATNTKLKGVAKNFIKIKKMDRTSKEEFLTYFKPEKFSKGTVIVNHKSKIEEIYIIQTGKVILCVQNETIPSYPQSKIVVGVLGPDNMFNEIPLLFEKGSPYYAVCLEDVELLSVGKTNLGFVTDVETLGDLRGNSQCRQRLQATFLEKYEKMAKDEIEASQKKICEKAGISTKELMEVFEKFDPKSKNSIQFAKNLEKFNKATEKPGANNLKQFNMGPIQKFSEFATPRLVSKDPNFRNLDPQRQLALLALRNEGANRRAGNAVPQKNLKDMKTEDIMKMQSRLLNEEKAECEKIMNKKTISEKLGINAPEEEKKDALEDKKGLFNKMKMDNRQLLEKIQVGLEEKSPTNADTSPVNANQEAQEVKPSIVGNEGLMGKPAGGDADEKGLKITQKNLANILGTNAGPMVKPQSDIINKKRTNLLKNANML